MISVDWTELALPLWEKKKVLADARRVPFPANFFPVVFSKQVYHYLDNPDLLLDEMVRVLAPGGLFILIDGEYIRPLNGRDIKDDELSRELKLEPQEITRKLTSMGITGLRMQRHFLLQPLFPKWLLLLFMGERQVYISSKRSSCIS